MNYEKLAFMQIPNQFYDQPTQTVFKALPSKEIIVNELRRAVRFFSRYKMKESAKWISELMLSISEEKNLSDLHK